MKEPISYWKFFRKNGFWTMASLNAVYLVAVAAGLVEPPGVWIFQGVLAFLWGLMAYGNWRVWNRHIRKR